jgi:hypothetical protein
MTCCIRLAPRDHSEERSHPASRFFVKGYASIDAALADGKAYSGTAGSGGSGGGGASGGGGGGASAKGDAGGAAKGDGGGVDNKNEPVLVASDTCCFLTCRPSG